MNKVEIHPEVAGHTYKVTTWTDGDYYYAKRDRTGKTVRSTNNMNNALYGILSEISGYEVDYSKLAETHVALPMISKPGIYSIIFQEPDYANIHKWNTVVELIHMETGIHVIRDTFQAAQKRLFSILEQRGYQV